MMDSPSYERPFPLRLSVTILLLGSAGSGKGTQARRKSRPEYVIPHKSPPGDMLQLTRSRDQTPLVLPVLKPILEGGELVPELADHRAHPAAAARGPTQPRDFVLDGFPAPHMRQADALRCEGCARSPREPDGVLSRLQASELNLHREALKRAGRATPRIDTPEAIRRPASSSTHRENRASDRHYRTVGVLVPIHADGTPKSRGLAEIQVAWSRSPSGVVRKSRRRSTAMARSGEVVRRHA